MRKGASLAVFFVTMDQFFLTKMVRIKLLFIYLFTDPQVFFFSKFVCTQIRYCVSLVLYFQDRKIDMETFYQGYALDLCRRIQVAVENYDSVSSSDDNPSSEDTKSDPHIEDPKTLVLHACVVAGWITVPLCRIKVVTKLASLVPFPWPSELMELVDKILKLARDNRLLRAKPITFGRVNNRCHAKYGAHVPQLLRLERLASISRIQEILSRSVQQSHQFQMP